MIRLLGALDRRQDKPIQRPPDVAFALDDVPPAQEVAPLVVQQLAIQSIYFLLPGIVASAFGLGGLATTNFLCLTIAGLGIAGLLQVASRGPFGSGYALPAIPSPVFLAAYLLAAETTDLAQASVLTVVAGACGMVLALVLRRLQSLVPTEAAGVVVFMIGVSLLPRAFASAAGPTLDASLRPMAAGVALGSLALMMLVALLRTGLSRFGVLLGAAIGCAVAIALGLLPPNSGELLREAPWLALPVPSVPRLGHFDAALLPAFLLTLVAATASWLGDLVAFQRAADGSWVKPDPAPIRRGLLANSVAVVASGLIGGMAPATSSACVGLAIATRTLSRVVAILGGIALLALACMPKLVALFALVPDPVKAAMLGYVCCFMMARGCQLITARMLDARRTFVAGLGLATGIGVLIAPDLLAEALPRALRSPVAAAALVAFALNLLTAPLVARQAGFEIWIASGRMPQDIADRCEEIGGAWGTRRATMERAGHALIELAEVLAGRGIERFRVTARHDDDLVRITLAYAGEPLPRPAARPDASDLDGPLQAQEAFAVWLATRQAQAYQQRHAAGLTELRLEFAD